MRSKLRLTALAPLIDQGLSAVSNLMLLVAVTRTCSTRDVGSVALALTAYSLIIGSARAWILDPLLLRRTTLPASQVLALVALLGLPIALCGMVITLGLRGGWSPDLWMALWVGVPMLLLQDGIRYVGFAENRPFIALIADGFWVAGFCSLLGLRDVFSLSGGLGGLTWMWIASAAFGTVSALIASGHTPAVRPWSAMWRSFTAFHHSLLAEYSLSAGVGQVTTFVLPSFVGLAGIGAFRTGQAVFGLTNVLFSAAYVRTLPACSARYPSDRPWVYRRLVGTSLALAAAGAAATVALLALPDNVGLSLLHTTWLDMRSLVLPLGLSTVAGGLLAGASMGIRVVGGGRDILAARLVTVTWATPAVLVGAEQWGVTGAAWGTCLGVVFSVAVYWTLLIRADRRQAA